MIIITLNNIKELTIYNIYQFTVLPKLFQHQHIMHSMNFPHIE